MSRSIRIAAAVLGVLLLGSACSSGTAPGTTQGSSTTTVASSTSTSAVGTTQTTAPPDLGEVRIAVGASQSIEFAAADLGLDLGVWKKRGLTVNNISVSGGGQVAQSVAAGEADIGLTGGPGAVAPIVKGLQAKLIAATSLNFVGMVVAVRADGPVQSISDLKGKTIGFSRPGSLTDYAAEKIAVSQGWKMGTDVYKASIGGIQELMAALTAGSIDAFTWSPEAAYQLEEKGQARIVGNLGEIVGPNVFESAYATDTMIANRPDAVKAYLEGYFEAVQWMKDHKEEAIAWMVKQWGLSDYAVRKTYEISIGNLSVTGEIPDANLQGVAAAVAETNEDVSTPPDPATFFDSEFVPVHF